ncbi:MAG: SUMF1/EgtB/PvdO family nonheme iron enzyme [Gemmataceae bacterium]
MNELEAMFCGILKDPCDDTGWLALADLLDENDDDPGRGELLRLHRKLLGTCCEPEAHPERKMWQARIVELIGKGVRPCVPRREVQLPGGVSMTFSFIPPGSFLMGGTVVDAEKPVHRVTLTKGFFLGVYPVTQEQWKAVMGNVPSHFKGAKRPVEQVSWDDCQEFCKKVTAELKGGRVELPTEAEWEWACRAGTTSEYHFGDVLNVKLANYDGQYSWNGSPKGKYRKETTDVGSFPSNPWGLHDFHGNVWEWCSDWYGEYAADEQTDPLGQSNGQYRVLRGGSWLNYPRHCRAAYRDGLEPANRGNIIGFRVCFRLD